MILCKILIQEGHSWCKSVMYLFLYLYWSPYFLHFPNGLLHCHRSKVCLPHLKKRTNPHLLNLSPPLNMSKHWFSNHVAYTMAKYGMSMCVLGMAEEFASDGIAVNALWPRTGVLIGLYLF